MSFIADLYKCNIKSHKSNKESKQWTYAMIVLVERYCKTCVWMIFIYLLKRNLYVHLKKHSQLFYHWLRSWSLLSTILLEKCRKQFYDNVIIDFIQSFLIEISIYNVDVLFAQACVICIKCIRKFHEENKIY